jgi:hypothetical protein
MQFVLGALSIFLTIAGAMIFNSLFGIEIHSWILFFIIPIGGIFIGMGAAYGLFFGIKKLQILPNRRDYYLGALIGLIAFMGIYFVDYKTYYINQNQDMVKNFAATGEMKPISDYISFFNFLSLINSDSDYELRFRSFKIAEGIQVGTTITWIYFFLNVFGSIVGGALVGSMLLGKAKYCHKCKRYFDEKNLVTIDGTRAKEAREQLALIVKDPALMQKFIEDQPKKRYGQKPFLSVYLQHCIKCADGYLSVRAFNKGNEIDKLRSDTQVNVSFVQTILATVKGTT